MLLDVLLVTDTCDEMNLLAWKCLSALFKHVRVTNVEGVEYSIRVNPQNFLFTHIQLLWNLNISYKFICPYIQSIKQ